MWLLLLSVKESNWQNNWYRKVEAKEPKENEEYLKFIQLYLYEKTMRHLKYFIMSN